jgi:DNA repair ATPase RecN
MIEATELFKLIGIFLTISVIGWGVVKWLLARIDATETISRSYTDQKHNTAISVITRVDDRLNEVKDDYVKRAELDRDFKALEKRLESTEKAISEGRAETNQRLDRMLMLLGQVINNTTHED